ncbi:MAG: DoxX family protein [Candidatus Kariarchaeaceae archaeon]
MIFSNVFPNDIKNWVKQYPDKFGIVFLRIVFAVMWLSQGFAKIINRSDDMYLDHDKFLSELNGMRADHPYPFVANILEDVLIPNVEVLVVLVIMTELFIAFSLGFGVFTRLGSIVGGLMTINLWILTLGWDEWFWTYPLIFFPHILFLVSRSGREIGIDRVLAKNTDNRIIDLLI